jgi:hypothetical protein
MFWASSGIERANAGPVQDLNLGEAESGLREFLLQEQTGARRVARELFRIVSADRAGHYSIDAAERVTRVLDLELRPLGIRVNAVAPQLLDTARNRPYLTPDLLAHAAAPEAVADIIVYLVSDAAALVSGAVVPAYGA